MVALSSASAAFGRRVVVLATPDARRCAGLEASQLLRGTHRVSMRLRALIHQLREFFLDQRRKVDVPSAVQDQRICRLMEVAL